MDKRGAPSKILLDTKKGRDLKKEMMKNEQATKKSRLKKTIKVAEKEFAIFQS